MLARVCSNRPNNMLICTRNAARSVLCLVAQKPRSSVSCFPRAHTHPHTYFWKPPKGPKGLLEGYNHGICCRNVERVRHGASSVICTFWRTSCQMGHPPALYPVTHARTHPRTNAQTHERTHALTRNHEAVLPIFLKQLHIATINSLRARDGTSTNLARHLYKVCYQSVKA